MFYPADFNGSIDYKLFEKEIYLPIKYYE
jgi:hypothetical protein